MTQQYFEVMRSGLEFGRDASIWPSGPRLSLAMGGVAAGWLAGSVHWVDVVLLGLLVVLEGQCVATRLVRVGLQCVLVGILASGRLG